MWGEEGDFLAPEPGDYLEFDGYNVRLCDEEGFMKGEWDATSGMLGSSFQDQGKSDYGPIPEGTYEVNPEKIDYLDPDDSWAPGDWGKSRVKLTATPETKRGQLEKGIDRWGLFGHGGERPGTLGCLDFGDDEEDFFNTLEQYDWPLYLEVYYFF